MLTHRPAPNPSIAARQFGAEIVAIDPRTNMVRMLNRTGSRIWQLMDGRRSVEEIARILAGEYEISPSQGTESVRSFLTDLQEKGLVD